MTIITKYTLPDWIKNKVPPPEWYEGKIKINNKDYDFVFTATEWYLPRDRPSSMPRSTYDQRKAECRVTHYDPEHRSMRVDSWHKMIYMPDDPGFGTDAMYLPIRRWWIDDTTVAQRAAARPAGSYPSIWTMAVHHPDIGGLKGMGEPAAQLIFKCSTQDTQDFQMVGIIEGGFADRRSAPRGRRQLRVIDPRYESVPSDATDVVELQMRDVDPKWPLQ
jgi:hypothetical protein